MQPKVAKDQKLPVLSHIPAQVDTRSARLETHSPFKPVLQAEAKTWVNMAGPTAFIPRRASALHNPRQRLPMPQQVMRSQAGQRLQQRPQGPEAKLTRPWSGILPTISIFSHTDLAKGHASLLGPPQHTGSPSTTRGPRLQVTRRVNERK